MTLFSIPSWAIYLFIRLAVAAVGVVIVIILFDQRRLKRMSKLGSSGSLKSMWARL